MTVRERLRTLWQDRVDPKTYLGLHLTIGLVILALCVWLFSALLEGVLENDVFVRWDMSIDATIHAHMTALDFRVVNVVTQLGSPVAMALLCLAGALWLWRVKRRTVLMGWLAAFVGGAVLDQALKLAVHRSRPEYASTFLHGHSYSFPSGHAMGSIIGYGMLIYISRHAWQARRHLRRAAYSGATLLVIAIGLSRILLGVHYPSDVLGGWAAGVAWMTVCLAGIGIAQQRQMDRVHPVAATLISR
ncbi:MAG: phosphatase PAP2 family protein [Gemmatimonadota bacterium]|nr:phosphatase PAP2 family protein [Gemmatimonadota bacterium]